MTSVLPQCSSSKSVWSESPRMGDLLSLDIDKSFIEYIVHCTIETVDYALGRPCTTSFNGRPNFCPAKYGSFSEFVSKIIYRSTVEIPVLLATLVYIERAKLHLKICIEQWACERVVMGALVLAGKYLNDYAVKNVHWARWSGVFHLCDISRMEREFLNILDWDLTIRESDILAHHEFLMSSCRSSPHSYLPSVHGPFKRSRLPDNSFLTWHSLRFTFSPSSSSSMQPPSSLSASSSSTADPYFSSSYSSPPSAYSSFSPPSSSSSAPDSPPYHHSLTNIFIHNDTNNRPQKRMRSTHPGPLIHPSPPTTRTYPDLTEFIRLLPQHERRVDTATFM